MSWNIKVINLSTKIGTQNNMQQWGQNLKNCKDTRAADSGDVVLYFLNSVLENGNFAKY